MKLVFAGTPDIAAMTLQSLIDANHEIIAAYTQPDRPAGRGKKLTKSPVKVLAEQHNISIEQPQRFDEQAIATLKNYQPDMMIVIAYGVILPKAVLDIPTHGCINVHYSLLPRWRGAAPIQHAILAGDTQTGVTVMQMDEGLDTGPMLKQTMTTIVSEDTSQTLYDRLAALGASCLCETLEDYLSLNPKKQDSTRATYARKIQKNQAKIDWQDPAIFSERKVRAYYPWPVAFVEIDGQPVRIWEASIEASDSVNPPGTVISADKSGIVVQTGENALRLIKVQLPGKRAMPVSDVLNAYRSMFATGKQL
ncbi:MAG: methionyl-tRNA formyltransferase [Gammaproteobacteria bacterium]